MPSPKRLAAVALASAMLTATIWSASPAEASAVARISIAGIYYNSPGHPDSGTNASINGEYIRIKNNSTTLSRNLQGWTIKDKAGHKFTFPSYTLGANQSVVIHTGVGTNRAGHLYWGQDNYVWNNDTDLSALRSSAGKVADTCGYANTTVSAKVC